MKEFSFSNGDPSQTSKSLLEDAKSGDPEQWALLVRLYGLRIYRMCKNAGIPEQDSSDITQDVFSAVSRALPNFRHGGPEDSFRHWLSRITTNKIRDYFRKQGLEGQGGSAWQARLSEIPDELSQSWADVRLSPLNRSRMQVVEQVRAVVSDRDWQVFERLMVDEWPVDRVASDFELPASNVYTIKSRILKKFRSIEKESCESSMAL